MHWRKSGVSVEVVDLRCLMPLDLPRVIASVKKTGRLVVAEPGWRMYGAGAEIVATVVETLGHLRSRPQRVAWPHSAVPTSARLEEQFYPDPAGHREGLPREHRRDLKRQAAFARAQTSDVRVPFSYLPEQFDDPEPIFARLREIIATGDYTLGKPVEEFETRFAELVGCRHAIGVNSGTDALRLCLKAVGVGPGDEVITAANTFIATVGAIADVGARTVFVDCTDDFCMDVAQLADAITPRTKAVIPVHLSGAMVDMPALLAITQPRGIPVIEDACQAIKSSLDGRAGRFLGHGRRHFRSIR